MSPVCFDSLPTEIFYLIFQYLNKEHVAYAFFGLNSNFTSKVRYFIGKELNLAKIEDDQIFRFCLNTILPSIGYHLRYLSIGSPHSLSTYLPYIQNFCPNLNVLNIHCQTQHDDIRRYAAYLIHSQLMFFVLMYRNQIVGEEISMRLIEQHDDKVHQVMPLSHSLILNLPSWNDLILLKRFSESSFLFDGLYMIECVATGHWLTDGKDDLCVMSQRLHRDSIFSIKHVDVDQCSREYEVYNEGTQRRLTVLIPYEEEEERWSSSSILSTHRKESSRSCSSFTFEKLANDDIFYIRPCYSYAKRLQVYGKRIIVSRCDNENVTNHYFKLHRIS
ncbi:unnamed protein product [Adineta ricciae]|uniref:F-box domain-containing protein n=1 Tax=Adineta ricciae TaxID=249248 RepID=A0A814PJ25_ADIRI|nr:unnamed protein product [Adineta ricciae]